VSEVVSHLQIFATAAVEMPLLAYALKPFPNPLAAGAAELTLVASNSGGQFVTVTSIDVTLPVGTNAKALTASAAGIGTVRPSDWDVTQNGGVFTFTPNAEAARIGPRGLTVVFTGITVNDQPGTCAVTITEQASAPGKPVANRTTTIALAKFPPSFALSELSVAPPAVAFGGTAFVFWTGSPATYTLSYDPDGDGTQTVGVDARGAYPATGLTAPVVVFTLTASVTVPGQDHALTFHRQAVATIVSGSVAFAALPSVVGVNGVARLSWSAHGTTSCTLDPGGAAVPKNGYAYVVVPRTTTFTLRATVTGREPIAAQQTVTVDPAIVATESFALTGKDGRNGGDGASYPAVPWDGGEGEPGGPGGPSEDRTLTVGPLDGSSTPAAVAAVLFRGGSGGRGGNGGRPIATDEYEFGVPGPGGRGGDGGDTRGTLTIVFDPARPVQQLMVTIEPGPPGSGGHAGNTHYAPFRGDAPAGEPGENTATLHFAELQS
jgi:hypothetical protein